MTGISAVNLDALLIALTPYVHWKSDDASDALEGTNQKLTAMRMYARIRIHPSSQFDRESAESGRCLSASVAEERTVD